VQKIKKKVESRLRQLEGKATTQISGTGKSKARDEKYDNNKTKVSGQKRISSTYNTAADVTMGITPEDKSKKEKNSNNKLIQESEKNKSDDSDDSDSSSSSPKKKAKKEEPKKNQEKNKSDDSDDSDDSSDKKVELKKKK